MDLLSPDLELDLARKIFWLLREDHIFLSGYNEDTQDWDKGAYPVISCNDVFAFACADGESLTAGDLDSFIAAVKRYPEAGACAWCAVKRDMDRLLCEGDNPKWAREFDEAVIGIREMLARDGVPK